MKYFVISLTFDYINDMYYLRPNLLQKSYHLNIKSGIVLQYQIVEFSVTRQLGHSVIIPLNSY